MIKRNLAFKHVLEGGNVTARMEIIPETPVVHAPVRMADDVSGVPENLKIDIGIFFAKFLAVRILNEPIRGFANLFNDLCNRMICLFVV